MGWFDEQIRERRRQDNEGFAEAMDELASAAIQPGRGAERSDREQLSSAIQEIMSYYRIKTPEPPESCKTLDEQLEFFCRPSGVMRRRVELDRGWYRDAVGAMLGTRKDGSTVALIPDRLRGYSFYDGQSGKRVRLNAKTEGLLERDAVCFYKPLPLGRIGIPALLRYIYASVSTAAKLQALLIMAAATLVNLLMPKITHIIFSEVVVSGSLRLLLSVGVLYVGVSLSSLLMGAVRNLSDSRISAQMEISVQAATMARILSLPAGFFKDYSAGELASRSQYINSLCSMLTSAIMVSGLSTLFSLVYISQIFVYTPSLVVPSLLITALTIAFTILNASLQMREDRLSMGISSKKDGMTYALITGVQKLKLSGSEKRAFSRWARLYRGEVKHTYGVPRILLLSDVINTAIALLGTIVLYFFAVRSSVSVADYNAFMAAYGMVSGAFMSAAGIAVSAARIKPVLEMAKPILDAKPEVAENKQMVTRLSGGIELSHVSFRYNESMPNVLDDLSLSIRPGQYVAIVGRTGCGKSTLVRLLLGFERPQKGAVYYDGKDIDSLDLKSLRRNIGTVMQNGKLFQGSIRENIAISAPGLSLEEVWEAAELSGLADDIRAMPMGMNTMIAEGAGGISGGQKQRLMIARAVAPKPRLLIFDEATSALDNITQKKVSEALDGLKCTRLVIAHRLSTIRRCDRIIVLEGGRIAEDGSYDELIQRGGVFASLVERQRIESGAL